MENNLADHASRRLSAVQLKESNWLKGPDFLWQRDFPHEEKTVGEIEMADPEHRKAHIHTIKMKKVNSMVNHFTKFSDWSQIERAFGKLKRFVRIQGSSTKNK